MKNGEAFSRAKIFLGNEFFFGSHASFRENGFGSQAVEAP
jgi:hypothetical protein